MQIRFEVNLAWFYCQSGVSVLSYIGLAWHLTGCARRTRQSQNWKRSVRGPQLERAPFVSGRRDELYDLMRHGKSLMRLERGKVSHGEVSAQRSWAFNNTKLFCFECADVKLVLMALVSKLGVVDPVAFDITAEKPSGRKAMSQKQWAGEIMKCVWKKTSL